jgi:hypothetical protein
MRRLGIGAVFLFFLASCQSEQNSILTPPPSRTPTATLTPSPPTPTPTITPTSTDLPPFTPSPTTIGFNVVRLDEDFSGENSCVQQINIPQFQSGIADGEYRLTIVEPEQTVSFNCETLVVGDLSLEVDISV